MKQRSTLRAVMISAVLVVITLIASESFVDMRVVGKELRPIGEGVQYCARYRTLYGGIEQTCTTNFRCFAESHVGDRLPETCR